MDANTNLESVKLAVAQFALERDWQQFHTPKNLSMAIAAEAGELMEHFLWATPQQSIEACEKPERLAKIEEELADVLIFGLQFANIAKIDVASAILAKISKNAARYPVGKAKGRSDKYTEL